MKNTTYHSNSNYKLVTKIYSEHDDISKRFIDI
jgi:hypothetical protein